jgi:SH3-like domain-containing protein
MPPISSIVVAAQPLRIAHRCLRRPPRTVRVGECRSASRASASNSTYAATRAGAPVAVVASVAASAKIDLTTGTLLIAFIVRTICKWAGQPPLATVARRMDREVSSTRSARPSAAVARRAMARMRGNWAGCGGDTCEWRTSCEMIPPCECPTSMIRGPHGLKKHQVFRGHNAPRPHQPNAYWSWS